MLKEQFNFVTNISIIIATLICCVSCASLAPQYLGNIEKEEETKPFDVNKEYIFSNYPHNKDSVTEFARNENMSFAMLWKHIEPKFKVEGTDWMSYKVKIEVKPTNKMEFTLIDSLGNTIRKKRKGYKIVHSFSQLKPKFWLWNNYVVINGFESQISAFSLGQEGSLIAPQHSIDGAFLIVMPFAGAQVLEVYKYQPTQ